MSAKVQTVGQCCAAFYGSDLARLLLGESFHPGGTALTQHLGEMLGIRRQSHVLDVASGRGTSAFHLAESFGCRVTGIDLSTTNVDAATTEASQRGLDERVAFHLGNADSLPFREGEFDAIICECAFCMFSSKPTVAQEFYRVLRPGGQLGLSDLTRTPDPIPEFEGLLAWIACIGDAQPLDQYSAILALAGFESGTVEDHSSALVEMVEQIRGRLLWAEIMTGLKKLDLAGVDFSTAKQLAQAAHHAIQTGKLGYAILTCGKSEIQMGVPRS